MNQRSDLKPLHFPIQIISDTVHREHNLADILDGGGGFMSDLLGISRLFGGLLECLEYQVHDSGDLLNSSSLFF